MKMTKTVMALVLGATLAAKADDTKIELKTCPLFPVETKAEKAARMQWWTDARFGMFIHFGLYAMPGRHEWVRKDEKIPEEEYNAKYFTRFNPDLFDAKKWVKAAKAAALRGRRDVAVRTPQI